MVDSGYKFFPGSLFAEHNGASYGFIGQQKCFCMANMELIIWHETGFQ